MTELVLDKSFLDGAPSSVVSDVFSAHRVLCTESLFYELITTTRSSQIRCFSKFPDRPNAFALIPNIGTLLRFEVENRIPCIPLFDRRIEGSYIFNSRLRNGTYVAEGEVLETLNAWRTQVDEKTKSFLHRCQLVYQFFPQLNGVEFRDFPTAVLAVRRAIATNEVLIRNIYASFLDEEAPPNALEPALLDSRWAWFRWVQCQLLATLRIFQRYQCRIPDPPTSKVLLRAEHSMHDIDHVLLGSLAGGIATYDNEIAEDFQLIRPDGLLLSIYTK